MRYKGYEARIEFDEDAHIFHGEVLYLRDVITFQTEYKKSSYLSFIHHWMNMSNIARK